MSDTPIMEFVYGTVTFFKEFCKYDSYHVEYVYKNEQ